MGVGAQADRPAADRREVVSAVALVDADARHLAEDDVLAGYADALFASRDARVVDRLAPAELVLDFRQLARDLYRREAVREGVAARKAGVAVRPVDGRDDAALHVVRCPVAPVRGVRVVNLELGGMPADGVHVRRGDRRGDVYERDANVVAAGAVAVALGKGDGIGAGAVGVSYRLYAVGRGHDDARCVPREGGAVDRRLRGVRSEDLGAKAADGPVVAGLGGRYLLEVVGRRGRLTYALVVDDVPYELYGAVRVREHRRVVHRVVCAVDRSVAVVRYAFGAGCPVPAHAFGVAALQRDHAAAGRSARGGRLRGLLPHERDRTRYRAAARCCPRGYAVAVAGYCYYVVLPVVGGVRDVVLADRGRARWQGAHVAALYVGGVGADDERENAAVSFVNLLLVVVPELDALAE